MTATELSKLTNLTNRQLQWWDERGYVKPIRAANRQRIYSDDQARLMALMAQFRGKGVPLQELVSHMGTLKIYAQSPGFVLKLRRGFLKAHTKAECLKIAASHRGPVLMVQI